MKRMVTTGILLLTAAAMTACLTDAREYDGYNEQEWEISDPDMFFGNVDETNMSLTATTLHGNMGSLQGFEHTATARGYQSDNFVMIDVLSAAEDGAAMQAVTFTGGLDQFEPGTTKAFQGDGDIHCSGPEAGLWDYDEPTDVEVATSATDNEDVIQLDISTTDQYGDTATSTVLVDRSDEL